MLKDKTLRDLRGWAIFGVLLIHATAPSISRENIHIPFVYALVFINQLSRYSVPLFFFISGYLYAKKKRGELNYRDHISRRFKVVGVPYIFWSAFYLCLDVFIGDIQMGDLGVTTILITFLSGSAYGHLYFIPALFQFYILLPLFLICLEKIKSESANRIALMSIMLIAVGFYHIRIHSTGSSSFLNIMNSDWIMVWWLPFIMAGMLWDRVVKSLNLKIVAVVFVIVSLILMNYEYLSCYYHKPYYYSGLGVKEIATFLRPSALIYAFSSIYLLIFIVQEYGFYKTVIGVLGKYSFGIYLIHPFINKILIFFLKSFGMKQTAYLYGSWILIVAGIPISILCVVVLSNIRGAHIILGHNR